jgi:hypothetical protein
MADASRGLSYLHLVNVARWHISDENYVGARAAIINAQHRHPMAAIWDGGTTSLRGPEYSPPKADPNRHLRPEFSPPCRRVFRAVGEASPQLTVAQ